MNIPPGLEFGLAIGVFVISLWVGIVGHEFGHYFAAKLVSLPVSSFLVGKGPLLGRWRQGITSFEFRLFPTQGFVRALPVLSPRKYSLMVFVLGGCTADLLLIGLTRVLEVGGAFQNVPSSFITAIYFAFALHLLNLIPGRWKLDGRSVATDGAKFLSLLFKRRPKISPDGSYYLDLIHRYMPQEGAEILQSSTAPYVLFLAIRSDRWANEANRREIDDEFQRLLNSETLSRPEEVLVLDGLLTSALVYRDATLLPQIEEWSLHSLELAPNSRPLLATRGGVLAETGRYLEAKNVMKPIVSTTDELNERFLCHLFLALSELRLGNEKETFRHLWELRKSLSEKTYSNYYLSRLTEIEREALETWPASEGRELEASAA